MTPRRKPPSVQNGSIHPARRAGSAKKNAKKPKPQAPKPESEQLKELKEQNAFLFDENKRLQAALDESDAYIETLQKALEEAQKNDQRGEDGKFKAADPAPADEPAGDEPAPADAPAEGEANEEAPAPKSKRRNKRGFSRWRPAFTTSAQAHSRTSERSPSKKPLTAAELNGAMNTLNNMIEAWNTEKLAVPGVRPETFALTGARPPAPSAQAETSTPRGPSAS